MSRAISSKMLFSSDMMLFWSFFTLYVVNALVLWIANMLFPQSVVLGTHSLSPMWAIVLSMSALALVGTLTIPLVHLYERSSGAMFSAAQWMILYFFENIAAFWLITRYSEQFGVGIVAWYWAVILALVWDVAQGVAMMSLEKLRAK